MRYRIFSTTIILDSNEECCTATQPFCNTFDVLQQSVGNHHITIISSCKIFLLSYGKKLMKNYWHISGVEMLNRIAEVVLTTLLPKSDFGVKGLRMTK